MSVTIRDVARLADVSISTVSYALNNSDKISEETRKKITDIANELGYQPNGIARSLKTKRTDLIGVFMCGFDGPVHKEIRRAIKEVCRKNDYEVLFAECDDKSNSIIKVLSQRMVDGAIILAPTLSDDILKSVARKDMPIVVMDRDINHQYISTVLVDDESAGYEVAEYFASLGYTDVGFIKGTYNDFDNKRRFKGFSKGVSEFNLTIKKNWVMQGDFTEISGYYAMDALLKNNDELPRAIFVANDEMAIGAMKKLQEENIRVPADIAIVGFDDIYDYEKVSPKLTTIKRPSYELGETSAKVLFDNLLRNKKVNKLTLATQLIERESC